MCQINVQSDEQRTEAAPVVLLITLALLQKLK